MAGPQDSIRYLLQIGDGGTTDVDVTDHVQAFSKRVGRDRETDSYQPGTATLTLLDTDRRFDPNNDASPYAGGITPLRRIRAQLDSANVENYVDFADGHVAADDSVQLSVTGDIDVRWFGTLDNWDNGTQTLISKWNVLSGDQRSWLLWATATGIQVFISTAGTAATESGSSGFAVPFADGDYGGIRFTRVQATGTTTVYFSTDDGETWDSAGSSTLAAGSALFDSTSAVVIGGHSDGLGSPPTGRVLSAEMRSGVAGTVVASPTFTNLTAGRHLFYDPLVDEQGNTWEGSGADIVVHAGSRIFTGLVNDWSIDYLDGDTMAVVTVPCTDGLGVLANAEIDTIAAAHNGDTSGVRVARVLERAEVAYDDVTSIDDGLSTFGNTTFGANALEYLQRCAKGEAGYLFVDRNGTLQFRNRHSLLNDSTTALEFADTHAAGGIKYRRLTQTSAADLLYNRITGAGTTGLEQAVSDATSRGEYKTRTLPLGEQLLSSDTEVLSLLEWHLERFKEPEARFSSIEINTMAQTDADAEAIALLDLATLVSVARLPLGGESYDPFELSDGGYTIEDLTLLDLDSGGYKEAA